MANRPASELECFEGLTANGGTLSNIPHAMTLGLCKKLICKSAQAKEYHQGGSSKFAETPCPQAERSLVHGGVSRVRLRTPCRAGCQLS